MQIEIRNLQFSFGEREVFRNINFSIRPNEVTAFIGVSGCGKTSLIKLLSGLLEADSGEILYGGEFNETLNKQEIAIIFQDSTLFPWKTVEDNIRLASGKVIDVNKIASEVGLSGALKLYPDQLSGGMKQRAEFGRVIVRSPKVLFMDEPFSRLDIQYRRHLQNLFLKIQKTQNPTTIIVTHDISEALTVAKNIKVLIGSPVYEILEFEVEEAKFDELKHRIENALLQDFKTLSNSN